MGVNAAPAVQLASMQPRGARQRFLPHSVRGAISGLLRKRLGLNVMLTGNAVGERVERIG